MRPSPCGPQPGSSVYKFEAAAHRLITTLLLASPLLLVPAAHAQSNNVEIGGGQELIVRDAGNLGSNNLGAAHLYRQGTAPGSSLVAEYNLDGTESASNVYAIGKVSGWWNGAGSNVGIHGHATDQGSGGRGVVGSHGGYVDPDETGIDSPSNWGALGTSGYAVYSNGEQFSTSGTLWVTSDARLKHSVGELDNALGAIRELRPSAFDYRPELRFVGLAVPPGRQYGFLAQEMEAVLPSLVRDVELPMTSTRRDESYPNLDDGLTEDEAETYKAIQVLGLIPVLTKAIQELDSKYETAFTKLAQENKELRTRLATLTAEIEGRRPPSPVTVTASSQSP